MSHPIMRKDLTGKKYGLLTPISVDVERTGDGKVFWLCKCDCGNPELVSVRSTSLTRKRSGVKSCGCLKRKPVYTDNTPIKMIGKKFGRLTVVGEAEPKSIGSKPRKKKQWYCNCDCGTKNVVVIGESLRSGTTSSCGCIYRESRHIINKKQNEYDLDSCSYGIGYCSNGEKFFFDKDDFDLIRDYCWSYDGRYVQAHTHSIDNISTAILRMHRLILGISDREVINVDHINGIGNDCRKINLRYATDEENARNRKECFATPENPVGIRKVNDTKYIVTICQKYYGTYNDFMSAYTARKNAEKEIYKDFQWNPNVDILDECK